MKKLFALVLALLMVTGNLAIAQSGPEVPASTVPATSTLSTEKINDVEVPYTILLDAQMVFQGFAVTEARQYRRGGQEVYALRMDNSDASRGSESFYLLFTTTWQYIGREKAPPPPPPTTESNPEEPKEEKPHENHGHEERDAEPQTDEEPAEEPAPDGEVPLEEPVTNPEPSRP